MLQFWWGHMENNSKVVWMSWVKLGQSKSIGVLGFRELECFNKALLVKSGWRLFKNPNTLVAQIFKEKYYLIENFLEAQIGHKSSYA
jgi:hypothetical protein